MSHNSMETINLVKPEAEVSSQASDDDKKSEEKVDSVDILSMPEKEPRSMDEALCVLKTVALKLKMPHAGDRLCDRKPSSFVDEYFVFPD